VTAGFRDNLEDLKFPYV